MGEVEAQTVGGNQRAGLAHVCAQNIAQLGVQQMRRRVVAHDVPAPVGVHLGQGRSSDAHRARGNLADVYDHTGDRTARIGDSHCPRGLRGRVDNHASIADLAAALDVERRDGEDDLDLLPGDRGVDQLAVGDDRDDFGLGLGGHQVDGVDAAGWQLLKHAHVDRKILALDAAKLGRCAGALALRLQCITIAGHVDGQPVFFGDVARQVQREAVGIPQAEGLGAGKDRLIVAP